MNLRKRRILSASRRFRRGYGIRAIFIPTPMILRSHARRVRSRERARSSIIARARSQIANVTRRDFLPGFFARRPNNQIRISLGARHVLLHREEAPTPWVASIKTIFRAPPPPLLSGAPLHAERGDRRWREEGEKERFTKRELKEKKKKPLGEARIGLQPNYYVR